MASVKTVLVGQDPFNREKIWQDLTHWQRGSTSQLTDRTLAIVEMALWDLAGRRLGVPVYKLIGGYRDKVPAYASTIARRRNAGRPGNSRRLCTFRRAAAGTRLSGDQAAHPG